MKVFTFHDLMTAGMSFNKEDGTGFGFTVFKFMDHSEKIDPQPEWAEATNLTVSKSYEVNIYASSLFGLCRFYTSTDEMTEMVRKELESLGDILFKDNQIENEDAILYRLQSFYILNKYNEHLGAFHLNSDEDLFYAIDFEELQRSNDALYHKLSKFAKKHHITLHKHLLEFEEEDGEHYYSFVNTGYITKHRWLLNEVIHALPLHVKAAVTFLCKEIGSITLAYGLVMGYFNEQEAGVLGDMMFEQFDKNRIIEPVLSKERLNDLMTKVRCFIKIMEKEQLLQLISLGENKHVEFKSSLRFNIRSRQFDKGIEHEVLKSITAFLNTDGGVLFIGIDDAGKVQGLEVDGFENSDRFLLYLRDLIVNRLVPTPFEAIDYEIVSLAGKQICRVKCVKASNPVYIRDQQTEEFYIRTGPTSKKLRPSEQFEYIIQRFKAP